MKSRRRAAAATLALLCVLGCGRVEGPEVGAAAFDPLEDDRVAELLGDCSELGTFAGDTSDLDAVLVGKLERGTMEVLHHVREELARSGASALDEIERFVRRRYGEPHGALAVANALEVLELMQPPLAEGGEELLLDCLGHPSEVVRQAAVHALGKHAGPEAYDALAALLRATNGPSRSAILTALHHSDPARFEDLLASWLVAGEHAGDWASASRMVAATAGQETGSKFQAVAYTLGDAATRAFLLSTLVGEDDGRAERGLTDLLEDEDPQRRGEGLAALEYTTLLEPALRIARDDEVPTLRALAVSYLGQRLDEPAARAGLRDALNDEDDSVRGAALSALLGVGDEAAGDTLLVLLDGSQRDRELATRASRGTWSANPGLAARVLHVLEARLEETAAGTLRDRASFYQSLALVPGPESTRYLLGVARSEEGERQGMSAHRWLTLQASNTGPAGQEVLAEAWRTETSQERRMDLLWAATTGHDHETAAFLREVLLDERSMPHERLYVAGRLAKEGPAGEVAALIKRAMLRETQRTWRASLNCLLWRWYGES